MPNLPTKRIPICSTTCYLSTRSEHCIRKCKLHGDTPQDKAPRKASKKSKKRVEERPTPPLPPIPERVASPPPGQVLTATLFVADIPHPNGKVYTEEALEKMANDNPFSMFTERLPTGNLALKARAHA